MQETHHREQAIFDSALELPPGERAAHLNHACGADTELRRRVEALLNASGHTSDYLDSPVVPAVARERTIVLTQKAGDTIGRYKLLQQIGEGGCGVVYMAEQEVPVRRRVALKVIKLGMDTKSVIARFEAERQALRRSVNAGATWTAAGANYQYEAGYSSFAHGFASDSAGRVFACGYGNIRTGTRWIVRRSADLGLNWTTCAVLGKGSDEAALGTHFVRDFGPANRGGLFVVGRLNSLWTVQRSRDGGNTWTTVDSWSTGKNYASAAKSVTTDPQGNIYVSGSSSTRDGNYGYVRMSSNGGDTWQVVLDKFGFIPAQPFLPYVNGFPINGMKFDSANTLWTIGGVNSGTANRAWTMLRRDGTAWSAPMTPYGTASGGMRVATDNFGNVYGVGTSTDAAGYNHLLLLQTTH